jgi:hypothetical protein
MTKKIKTVYIGIICSLVLTLSHAQNVHWGGVINTSYNDYIYDLQADNENNLIICGQFSGTVDFDPGPGVANLVTTSASNSDIFLAKYDSAGNYLWAHRFGVNFFYDEGDRIAVDDSGNIFITGMFGSTVDFDPHPVNTASITAPGSARARFLAKYDASGNFIAVKHVGNAVGNLPSSQDGQSGLGCDADGNVYMSGFYGTSLTLAPGTTLPVSGLSDNYFSKFDSQLNLIWAHRLGSNGTEYSQGMFVSPVGKIIVLGSFRNTIDFDPGPGVVNLTQTSATADGYFAAYDSAGQFLFVRQLEAGNSATPIATLIDSDQNIILAGSCTATMDADPGPGVAPVGIGNNDQAFIAAYDSIGNYRWAYAYGDVAAFNAIRYVGVDSSNNIYVAGNYNPMVDINPGSDTAVFGNKYGSYVASYDTSGSFRTAFFLQEVKMRVKGDDIYLASGFYGLVDFDPGPQVYPLQSDTANASWYLLRLHICDAFAEIPDGITASSVCAGDTVTLIANGGGPQYIWDFSENLTPIGSVSDSIIMFVVDSTATFETVFVSSAGGCLNSPLIYADINVNQPVVPPIYQSGDSLVTTPLALSYQWYLAGIEIPGANDSVYAPIVSGTYTVMTADSNGCFALSDTINFVISALTEVPFFAINVFPSPVTHQLFIAIPERVGEYEIFVSDISGRAVFYLKTNKKLNVIDTSSWADGIYTVSLKNHHTTTFHRVVKM